MGITECYSGLQHPKVQSVQIHILPVEFFVDQNVERIHGIFLNTMDHANLSAPFLSCSRKYVEKCLGDHQNVWSYMMWQPSCLFSGHLWQTKGQIGGGNQSGWGKKSTHKMPLCYLLPYDKDSVGGQIGNASETFPGHPQVVLCISPAQLLCSG